MIKKIKNYFNDSLFWLILSLFYFSNDSFVFGVNGDNNFFILQYIFLIIIFTISFFKVLSVKIINKKLLLIYILFDILLILSLAINNDSPAKYFYQIVIIGISVITVSYNDSNKLLNSLLKVIIFLSCASWIPYLTNIFLPQIANLFPTAINTANWRFHNMIVGVAPYNELYHSIYRNFSIFREPGVFAVFILLGLILTLFYNNKNNTSSNIKYITILTLTMLSTLSTAGTICYILIILFYFVSKKISKEKIMLFLILLFGCFYLVNFTDIPNRIMGKMFVENNPSTMSRVNSIKSNLLIFIDNPILGSGWGKIDSTFQETSLNLVGSSTSYGESSFHNTNTLLRILSTHGIIYFCIYIIGFLKVFNKITNIKIINYILAIIFAIMLSNENLTLNFCIYLLILLGYKKERHINESS